jgi:hypothetical protein
MYGGIDGLAVVLQQQHLVSSTEPAAPNGVSTNFLPSRLDSALARADDPSPALDYLVAAEITRLRSPKRAATIRS